MLGMHFLKNSTRFAVIIAFMNAACGEVPSAMDAGSSSAVDAGTSSAVDAGSSSTVDAGSSSAVDAGSSSTVDAGSSSTVDAGSSSTVDAGSSSTVDAGSSSTVDAGPSTPPNASCVKTICLTGAQDRSTWGNFPFQDMCNYDGIRETLIPFCVDGICHSAWETFFFQQDLERDLLPAIVSALDDNSDGYVTENDVACDLHIAGYSWGGVNAVKLARLINESSLFSGGRKEVAKVVVFDPYQIGVGGFYISENVQNYWSFRHSSAPSEEHYDCSRDAPLGPYMGIAPQCSLNGNCWDYDYSLESDVYSWGAYSEHNAGSLAGNQMGHCSVLEAAVPAGYAALLGEPLPSRLPTPRTVATY